MARNEYSSSGKAEDMIRAFQQMSCAELHLITLYEKTIAEMENGIVDVSDEAVRNRYIDKAEQYREDLIRVTECRREMMRICFSLFENGDKDVWCMVKHLGASSACAWEVYQASDDDPKLLMVAIEASKLFTKYITQFLGMEITDCASCLNDMLKGEM